MYRALLCIVFLACGPAPHPALSTVTIRQHRHVVLATDGPDRDQLLACSDACKDVACLVQRCGAREQHGPCRATDTAAPWTCRTFSWLEDKEREGTCKDPFSVPDGTELVSCTETRAASEGGGDGVGSAIVIFLIIPVALIVAIATAGPN